MANCPKCEKPITSVQASPVEVRTGTFHYTTFKGIAYTCPNCDSVLSVTLDQMTLMTETVDRIISALRK